MRIYNLNVGWNVPFKGEIHARHTWGLPGVHCPACDAKWGAVGIAYPTIDLSALQQAHELAMPGNVAWSEFERLRDAIAPHVPTHVRLVPGTDFGPLHGQAKGRADAFPSFVPMVPWTVCARDEVVPVLRAGNLTGIRATPLHLTADERPPALVELEAWPAASLVDEASCYSRKPCETCGRTGLKPPPKIVLDKTTIPDDDIFRGRELWTYVFVTERFVEVCRKANLTNMTVNEVEVA